MASFSRPKVILFQCFIILIFYVIAESIWALYTYQRGAMQWQYWYRPNGFVRFQLEPDLDVEAKTSRYSTSVKTNSLGFRGSHFWIKKPENTIRIICMGGSTTFGSQTSDNEHTYPYMLNQILSDRYENLNIEVINAGVPGYRTTTNLLNLVSRLIYYEPDIVIIYHAINDFANNISYSDSTAPFDILSSPWEKNQLKWKWLRKNNLLITSISVMKSFLQRFRRTAGSNNERTRAYDVGINPRCLEVFRNNLITMIRICNQYDIEPVVITFPYSNELRESLGDEILFDGMTGKEVARGLDEFRAEILSLRESEKVTIIHDGIPDNANMWGDYVHLNDRGSAFLAQNISIPIQKVIDKILMKREVK